MMFSFLASAVTISTGRLDRLGSARMFCSMVSPSMLGMFQSDTTNSKPPLRSFSSAWAPSSASSTFSNPKSLSRFLTILRMVGKSSTTRIFIVFCTTDHSPINNKAGCSGTRCSCSNPSNQVPVRTRAFQDAFAEIVQRDGLFGGADQQGLARHAEDDATGFVLGECARARLAHGQQPLGTVLAHAGQDDADGVLARDLGGRMEQHIHGGPVAVHGVAVFKLDHIVGSGAGKL